VKSSCQANGITSVERAVFTKVWSLPSFCYLVPANKVKTIDMSNVRHMTPEEYIANRVDSQIEWHEKKSGSNKKLYQKYQMIQLVVASLITLSATLTVIDQAWVSFVAPTLGAIVAVVSGILGLYKFQENWVDYRTTAEQLKQEKFLFLTGSEPYDTTQRFQILVASVEDILSKQNSKWKRNSNDGSQAEGKASNFSVEEELPDE